jgi:hypothetical protein
LGLDGLVSRIALGRFYCVEAAPTGLLWKEVEMSEYQ